ncbi:MAG: Sigma 54 modulation protein/ribosomal protein S30EA [Candidatus Falkowbacteria bacterium GW2011_GWC2_38_22]|uniref:Sigma 54 modulation protein/ribosomal protein S30EA n=1 Tax=Candidatus Falkowbacteria bacterium GW2011_GWE1_38_31 TaxID=1618638 RepID=A0A0G0K4I5_9BACT|nr:MAG: Sigma 54 modulation protein/ribosomal protein S30EA [Candidatus Falkowbacteria bacterium GW2011_GWF2_38_1205]KKQ61511.1 MAG: Sigma 54 modulation protein/ribosomal protein S30EA [Candidatus Falkowbacteria bacterium GW2011_GWC2_38_22]KKQ63596.1 MAG: Sigma 54 modulation protein/ribosomal protein S30EA [Candidatus Falkowbacteria bacterium GW2011_GWF1_38_22]KKQ65748.1 MAG: Sigma 54 modulation protein/ribosomal protein S30EA [Candidatus Falkowbacteria bacterium GW2011_GWE2_38_254]KKQ70365.1 M
MKITIKAKKITMSPNIKDYIQEKMDMLDKYLGTVQVTNCDVEIAMDVNSQHKGEIYRAEVNLSVPGELIRVEKTEKDLYKAIDKVKDHLARSIRRYKDIKLDKKRQGGEEKVEEILEV